MNKWKFSIDNNNLIKLVLEGKKTATTYLYNENDVPIVGEKSIICYDDNSEACIIQTKKYYVMKFNQMTESLAKLEGEGDLSLNYWRNVHFDFFKNIDKYFNEEYKIIFEIFKLIDKF